MQSVLPPAKVQKSPVSVGLSADAGLAWSAAKTVKAENAAASRTASTRPLGELTLVIDFLPVSSTEWPVIDPAVRQSGGAPTKPACTATLSLYGNDGRADRPGALLPRSSPLAFDD